MIPLGLLVLSVDCRACAAGAAGSPCRSPADIRGSQRNCIWNQRQRNAATGGIVVRKAAWEARRLSHKSSLWFPVRRETAWESNGNAVRRDPNRGSNPQLPPQLSAASPPAISHRQREGAGEGQRPASQETSPSEKCSPAVGGTARRSHEYRFARPSTSPAPVLHIVAGSPRSSWASRLLMAGFAVRGAP